MDRILIVDDEIENILLARTALERAGFEVEATTDPTAAASLAAASEFDAVVLDLVMPELSGFEVLSQLRADARTRSLPILFLSSRAQVSDRVRGLREGANDYLGKPFHPEELVLRVERLVASGSAGQDGLEGRLDEFLIADVIQTVARGGRSGLLLATGGQDGGRVVLREGRITAAACGRLTGRDALIAILGLRSGRFRFMQEAAEEAAAAAGPAGPAGPGGPVLDLRASIFEAAWLEEELSRREPYLPAPAAPLRAGPLDLQSLPEGMSEALAAQIHARVAAKPGLSLADLLKEQLAAPAEVRLLTAWWVEQGGLVGTERDPT